ncbi:MAG: hypothetical protein WC081_01625 [Candidatus Ratteibacteria bacterium]|jgi:hypothetical protein
MERKGICWKIILKVTGFLCVLGIVGYFFQTNNLRAESAISKEISKEIQKIKDAGEPTTIEELVPPDMPDGENGALVYNQAFYLLKELKGKHQAEWKYFPYEGEVKWSEVPEVQKEKVRNLLFNDPDFARFYQLLEKASGMKCQFLKRKDYEKGFEMLMPHLGSLRSCARMLAARADIQAEKGKIDNALDDCLTCLKISDSLSGEPILITGLVKIAIDQIALDRIEATIKKSDAESGKYRGLMAEIISKQNDKIIYRSLLDERVISGMVEFPQWKEKIKDEKYRNEVAGMSKSNRTAEDGEKIVGAIQENPVGFLEENELTYFQTMGKLIAFSKLPYLEAREEAAVLEKELSGLSAEKAALTKLFAPALTRTFLMEARYDAQLGNAEIALACHLYKAKNKNYPVSLKELSPDFLPKPLLDPFSGKEHIYQKTDKGFKIYSVGENMKDDGGQWADKPSQKWVEGDIVWEE